MTSWSSLDQRLLAGFMPTEDEQAEQADIKDRSTVELARSEIRYGNFNTAADMLERVASRITERAGSGEEGSRSQALLAVAYSVWGQGQEAWGYQAAAQDYFARAVDLFHSIYGSELDPEAFRNSIGARALSDFGLALAATGQDDAAREALEASRRAGASTPEALRRLAVYAMQDDRPDSARRLLSDALPVIPTDAECWYVEGMIRDRLDHDVSAHSAYRQSAALWLQRGAFSQAVPSLRRLRELDPDDVRTLIALAEALRGTGWPEEAEPVARRAIDIAPELIEARLSLALALGAQQRFGDAMNEVSTALEANPHDPAALLTRASLHLETGRLDECLADADRALAGEPDLYDALLVKARALIGLERYHDARDPVESALRLSPGNVGLATSAAWLASKEDDSDAVIEILTPFGLDEGLESGDVVALVHALLAADRTNDALMLSEQWHVRRPDDDELRELHAVTKAHLAMFADIELDELQGLVNEVTALAPSHPDVLVLRAQLARQQDRDAEAEELLTDSLRADPGHLVALGDLAELLLDGDRPAEAERWAREGLARSPSSWFRLLLAYAVSDQERHRETLALLHEVPDDLGDSLVLWLRLRAEANEHLGRWADAQTAWETIVDLNEDDDDTWFRLADSARLAGDWQTAVRAAERALELSPDHHPAMATLGTAFADAGDNTKAREMLDLVLTLDDSYEFALAQRAHVATTLEDALRDIDRLEALSDDIGLVHRNRGWVYMDYDMYKEALVSFEQALAVDPDDVSALTNAAICSTSLGRPERAVELAERAIAAQPDEVSALVALGSAQDLLGAPDEALLHLRRAYDLAPTIAGVLDQLLDTLRNLDRVEESLAILRELVVRRREDAATWRAVGRHLVEMGYFEEAVEPLRHSLALNSNQPWAHSNLGLALEMSDRPDLDAARQHFEQANALGSGLGLQLNLADIQHRLGDSSAPELYRTVVRLADQASGSDAYARWRKGWSLFRLGELERAGRQLFNLTSLPKDGDQVRLDLALVSLCRGREEESLQHYRATIASLASRDGRRRRNALIIARVDLSVARRDWQMNALATADTIDALLRKAIDETPRISVADLQPEQSPEAITDRN